MAEARIPENFGDTQIRVRVLDFMGLGLRMPREAWRLPSPQMLHWAWRTVAAMLAIWDYPKSWAHLATLPFPKPEGLGDAQKICTTHMT